MIETKKKLDRDGYFHGRPGPGRPVKLDYADPSKLVDVRLLVPVSVKAALAQHGKPNEVAAELVETAVLAEQLSGSLKGLHSELET